jgi:hypothetical protein
MSMNKLAEAIIYQATVDYCNGREDGSFFRGEGFCLYSNLAGMSHRARGVFMTMLRRMAVGKHVTPVAVRSGVRMRGRRVSPRQLRARSHDCGTRTTVVSE